MQIQDVIFLGAIALSAVTSSIYHFRYRKSVNTLPENWKLHPSVKKFKTATLVLCLYFTIDIVCETIAVIMARNGMYNCHIYSIYNTLSVGLFFSFLSLYTNTLWKRFSYLILFGILLGYFILSGQFHPQSVGTETRYILISSINVIGSIIHLTDLLVNPKVDHFSFQIKINLYFLIYNFLTVIILTFIGFKIGIGTHEYILTYIFSTLNAINTLFYLALALVFLQETLKLKRR